MNTMLDTVWQRRGISWIWDTQALSQICSAPEVWSMRQFLRTSKHWTDELPSNSENTLVVAGLEGSLDLLSPEEAETWLVSDIKNAILSFQDYYEGNAALIFWLPSCAGRIHINSATDAVSWKCASPYAPAMIYFGRILWGEAREYPQEIILPGTQKPSGLFHLRIT